VRIAIDKLVENHKVAVHGGIYSIPQKPNLHLLDFSSNVNPLGYPNAVKNTFRKNLSLLSIYPDPNSNELRNTLQKYTGISKDQIVVGNGATEIIYDFSRSFLKKQKVLIPVPTFSEYESASRLNGSSITYLRMMDINKNVSAIQDSLYGKKCVFLCNPNNPTGVLTKKKNMHKIIESAYETSSLVFLDECFIELVPSANESVVSYLREFDNLFILRSLTKSFGLAGIRIGYGLGNKKMIQILNRIKIPWNVNGIAQQVAIKALSDKTFLSKSKKMIKSESNFLIKSISKISGFSCYHSDTNFILVKSKLRSATLQKKLLKKNILVRDCSSFRGLDKNHIRIAVKTRKENLKLVEALKKL